MSVRSVPTARIMDGKYASETADGIPINVSSGHPCDGADLYLLASGFYGPGVFVGWCLIAFAVVFTWLSYALQTFPKAGETETRPPRSPRLSSDFIAFIYYPVAAAAHTLVRVRAFPADKRHGVAKALLAWSDSGRTGTACTETDLETLQHVVAINGALRPSEAFLSITALLLMLRVIMVCRLGVRRSVGGKIILIVMALASTWCCGAILAVLLLDKGHNFFPVLRSIAWRMVYTFHQTFFWGLMQFPFHAYFTCWACDGIKNYYQRPSYHNLYRGIKASFIFLGCLASLLVMPILMYIIYQEIVIPDVGVNIKELDQATAVCAGALSLAYSLFGIYTEWAREGNI